MIGERLAELRKAKGLKQYELANIIGIKKAAMSLYESDKGTPNDATKVAIARFFDVSLDYLLGVIDKQVPYYKEDGFLILPDILTSEDRHVLTELLGYYVYKRLRCGDVASIPDQH